MELLLIFHVGAALSSPNALITAHTAASQLPLTQAATGSRITVAGRQAMTWPTVALGEIPMPDQLVVVHVAHHHPGPAIDCRPGLSPVGGSAQVQPHPIRQANGQARLVLAAPSVRMISTTPITLAAGKARHRRFGRHGLR